MTAPTPSPRRLLPLGLLLAALFVSFVALLLLPVPPQQVPIGAPDDARAAVGFWDRERDDSGAFRWTQAASELHLTDMSDAPALLVELRMHGGTATTPLTVTLSGQQARFDVPPGWRRYRMLTPQPHTDWQASIIQLESGLRPAGPTDDRLIGLALSRLRADQLLRPALTPILLRALLLTLLAALPAALALWIGRRRLALGAAGGLGLLIIAGLLADRAALSFWLPQLWGIVGLGLLLLALGAFVRDAALPVRVGQASLALALLGSVLLALRWSVPLAWLLLIGGAALAAGALRPSWRQAETLPGRLAAIGLALAVLAGLAARLYRLGDVPVGLWRDEARYGLLAVRILREPDFRPVYVPGGVDYPALLFYLIAGAVKLFGTEIFAIRVVAAVAGGLTPLALYAFGRRLVGEGAALIAAGLVALSAWHISISRISFVAVLDPLLTMAGLALLWAALEQTARWRRLLCFVMAGLALGLALYTYHTARLTPLLALLVAFTVLGRSWARWRTALPGLIIAACVALVVLLPLIGYAIQQPENFNRRLGQTSALTAAGGSRSPTAVLDDNVRRYAQMWHLYGEPNGRHYIPGRPMVDPATGAALLIGLLALLARPKGPRERLLLAWLALGFVPPLLAEGAPHAVRSVGVIAPALLIAAGGIEQAARTLLPRLRPAAIAGALGSAALGIALYFAVMPTDREVWDKFYVPETEMTLQARQLVQQEGALVYLPRAIIEQDVVRYLLTDVPMRWWTPYDDPARIPSGAYVIAPGLLEPEEQRWIADVTASAAHQQSDAYPWTSGQVPMYVVYRMP